MSITKGQRGAALLCLVILIQENRFDERGEKGETHLLYPQNEGGER